MENTGKHLSRAKWTFAHARNCIARSSRRGVAWRRSTGGKAGSVRPVCAPTDRATMGVDAFCSTFCQKDVKPANGFEIQNSV